MSEERCDVAVIGAGLVGVSLAYELACLGTSVTVIDAGHPGRATDAGAGILSPVTSMETDEALWLFARQAGAHYPDGSPVPEEIAVNLALMLTWTAWETTTAETSGIQRQHR